ncbi:TPA: prepilin-type N-terminal cleavage/methylation domain-containing protein [Photobacterium damselae]
MQLSYSKKTENGFTLIELLVVLAVLTVLMIVGSQYYSKWQLGQKYEKQTTRLLILETLIQQATFQSGLPSSLEEMMSRGYDVSCPTTSAQCLHINKTMWGSKITLSTNATNMTAKLTVPLTGLPHVDRQTFLRIAKKRLPYAVEQGNNLILSSVLLNNKTWTIHSTGGSGGDVDGSLYIPNDGSQPLTGDWDVGDKKVTNVKDVIIGSDNPLTGGASVSAGLIRTSGSALSGQVIPKPKCTFEGAKPQLMTWFTGIAPNFDEGSRYTSISSVYARGIDQGNSWKLWTSFTAYNTQLGRYVVYNSTEKDPTVNPMIKLTTPVMMGYITLCR